MANEKITLQNMASDIYTLAHSKEMTLSSYLEAQDPTQEGSKLDAFLKRIYFLQKWKLSTEQLKTRYCSLNMLQEH